MRRLADLATILFRPRETMRRILDRGGDRWGPQIVVLAFVCASTNNIDLRPLPLVLPGLRPAPLIALAALTLIAGALGWLIALYILAWIAAPVGRALHGSGSVADVRTALGWAMAPVVWSVVYRLPLTIVEMRMPIPPNINARQVLLNYLAHGGCSLIVLFLGFQLLFAVWCIVLGSFTVGEAHRFGPQKGFLTVAITLAVPATIAAAAIFAGR